MKLNTFEKVNRSDKTTYVVFDGSRAVFAFTMDFQNPSNNTPETRQQYSALMGIKAWVTTIHNHPTSGILEVTVQLRKDHNTYEIHC